MNATQINPVSEAWMNMNMLDNPNVVDLWVRSCDNCMQLVTNPMVTTCGHLYCSPCVGRLGGITPQLTCPACNAALSAAEATVENMTTIMDRAPSRARIDFVQGQIDARRERNNERRVDLLRRQSEVRGRRIEELERVNTELVEENAGLSEAVELRNSAMSAMRARMRARIAQLEREAAALRARIAAEPEANRPTRRRRLSGQATPSQVSYESTPMVLRGAPIDIEVEVMAQVGLPPRVRWRKPRRITVTPMSTRVSGPTQQVHAEVFRLGIRETEDGLVSRRRISSRASPSQLSYESTPMILNGRPIDIEAEVMARVGLPPRIRWQVPTGVTVTPMPPRFRGPTQQVPALVFRLGIREIDEEEDEAPDN